MVMDVWMLLYCWRTVVPIGRQMVKAFANPAIEKIQAYLFGFTRSL